MHDQYIPDEDWQGSPLAAHLRTRIIPGTNEHRQLVSGSKIAAILGVSEYDSPAAMWHHMNGTVPPKEVTPAMDRGTIFEPAIREYVFKHVLTDWHLLHGEVTVTRPDLPWAAANPDAVAYDNNGVLAFAQLKSVARDDKGRWGKAGTDQVPLGYWVQVQWEMHMTHNFGGARVSRCVIVKHGPFVDQYDVYPIVYDAQVAATMQHRAHAFWQSLADPEGCPDPTGLPGDYDTFRQIHPDIEPDTEWEVSREAAADYVAGKEMQAQGKQLEDRGKALMLKAMGNARIATVDGAPVARRQPSKRGVAVYPAYTDQTANTLLGRAADAA